ncbi:hypothetical protein Tcan_09985 [Toxocara canis]|uniref:Uncharacterized protein n=1 Tax=Toxocara canis TaxID=6265 RepID=A0A0B2UV18_TOXCA|nr:hypothetical protein Tcan_09985 [Toxocara canis]
MAPSRINSSCLASVLGLWRSSGFSPDLGNFRALFASKRHLPEDLLLSLCLYDYLAVAWLQPTLWPSGGCNLHNYLAPALKVSPALTFGTRGFSSYSGCG